MFQSAGDLAEATATAINIIPDYPGLCNTHRSAQNNIPNPKTPMLDIILSTRIILNGIWNSDEAVKISVQLYGELKESVDDEKFILELANGSDINSILTVLNLHLEDVVITLVNGKAESLNYILENDDHVDIFPPLKGG